MRLYDRFWNWLTQPRTPARLRARPPRRHHVQLGLLQLEDRALMSSNTAGTVADLIADINAANTGGGSNTITLVAGTTFTLTAVDNTTDGATGLPVIAANDTLTIVGKGDTIQRSTASGTPAFRLFDVASGSSLTLQSLTVQNGRAQGNGVPAEGGALLNRGSLTLNGVTVQNNVAQGQLHSVLDGHGDGNAAGGGIYSSGALVLKGVTVQNNTAQGDSDSNAAGGGIYSSGSLSVQSSTIQNNQALGGAGFAPTFFGAPGDPGGSAFGGGLYISGGTATLTSVTLSSNTARGGDGGMGGCGSGSGIEFGTAGGDGGNGLGGGLYAAGGTIDVHNLTVTGNTAAGGPGGKEGSCGLRGFGKLKSFPGAGEGGGLYIDAAAAVCLDAFTQSHVPKNHASTSYKDIDGTYTTCP
jgi:hypothetical protein